MQRRSAIAVAGAVTGILIAGSVASVAVINAASSSTTTDDVPIVAANVIEPVMDQVVEPAPSVDSGRLPKIVVPEPIEITADVATEGQSVAGTDQPSPEPTAAKARAQSEAQPASTQEALAPATITAQQARQAATAATPGTVLAISRVERGGYDSFAVQIERADGSVVTGYVEASSGVVFDWVVDKKAPAPAATYDDDDDYDDDRDDHDDDHDDDDEYDDDDDYDDDERDGDDD